MFKSFQLHIIFILMYIKTILFSTLTTKPENTSITFLDAKFFTHKNLPLVLLDNYEEELERLPNKIRIVAPIFCLIDDWVMVDTNQEKIKNIIETSKAKDLEELSKEFLISFKI